jgi:hypothetical protein
MMEITRVMIAALKTIKYNRIVQCHFLHKFDVCESRHGGKGGSGRNISKIAHRWTTSRYPHPSNWVVVLHARTSYTLIVIPTFVKWIKDREFFRCTSSISVDLGVGLRMIDDGGISSMYITIPNCDPTICRRNSHRGIGSLLKIWQLL